MLNPIDVRYFKMAIGQQRIKHESYGDIQARCPICGDSKYSKNKARLHLYLNNGKALVNCFNECSCRNKTVYKFLQDYYPNLLESYKKETFETRFQNLKEINFNEKDLIGDLDLKTKEIQDIEIKPNVLFDLSQYFEESTSTIDYIESRGLDYFPEFGKFFKGKQSLEIDNKVYNIKDFIIIPFYYKNKMYGFYSRSMKEHKFYTYIPESNNGFKLWNFFNIDKSKTVYVFEGIFDAITAYQNGITNVVACCGATPPMELLKNLDVVFCLDNDRTGFLNSIKYAKQGFKVLVYPNEIKEKDLNEMFKNKVDIKSLICNNIKNGIFSIIQLQSKL